MSAATFVNFYNLMQLAPTANDQEITAAVRRVRRTWAKRAAQADPQRRSQAEEMMRQIDEAERTLKDPNLRPAYDQALQAYRPPPPDSAPTDLDHDWLNLARNCLALGNAHSANYAAREAIQLQGNSDEAWYLRANSSFLMGKAPDAEYEFNEAIRLRPDNPDYHFDLAEAYAAQSKWPSALGEYETALSLQPANAVFKTAIANVYLNNDMPQRALDLMDEVVQSHPDAEVFQLYLAWALHDATVASWAKLPNGNFTIISEAQIDLTERNMGRARDLHFNDPQLRAGIEENIALARSARQMKWVHSDNMRVYVFFWIVSAVMIAFYGVGLIPLALFIWIYTARHRKPRWKHTGNQTARSRVAPGI